jgi:NADPH-dependent F420 reductase
MKVAILGGTGKMGRGLALVLSKRHEVYIGSRDSAKAAAAAKSVGVRGEGSSLAAELCDAAILTIPYAGIASLPSLAQLLAGKLVISTIVPMSVENRSFYYDETKVSAAEQVSKALERSRVAAALHTIPARLFTRPEQLDADVPVAADGKKTYDEVAEIVKGIGNLRPLYAGPLSLASSIERLTPLLLNLAALNDMGPSSVKFLS